MPENADLIQLPSISYLGAYFISRVILHEVSIFLTRYRPLSHAKAVPQWTHHPAYDRVDTPADACYGWGCIVRMGRDDAFWNADSFAYLGLWALIADRGGPVSGYTLPRLSNPATQEEEDACNAGRIAYYHQLTSKRGLEAVARRYVA